MTDRYSHLTVALDANLRSDDAEALIAAIRQLRGVAAVSGNVADGSLFVAEQRVKNDLTQKLWAVLHPKEGSGP
jgi:hypothetical protein